MRISAAKNFDMLSISINALDFRVLQVWEQMLPFQGSSNLYAATRFLQSRLCSQADIDKVTALQNVYTKPRSEIFIPSGKGCKEGICVCNPKSGALIRFRCTQISAADTRLSVHSAQRRRSRTPIQAYVDMDSHESPSTKQGKGFDSDILMATIRSVSCASRLRCLCANVCVRHHHSPLTWATYL